MYEVGLNEPVLFFMPSGITKNTDVLVRLSWVQTCLSLFLPLVYLISSEIRFEKTTF